MTPTHKMALPQCFQKGHVRLESGQNCPQNIPAPPQYIVHRSVLIPFSVASFIRLSVAAFIKTMFCIVHASPSPIELYKNHIFLFKEFANISFFLSGVFDLHIKYLFANLNCALNMYTFSTIIKTINIFNSNYDQ